MTPEPPNINPITEDQMHAIDRGVVKVYINTRAILPPHLQGAGKGDPAAALRAVAYEYALTHRADIDAREDWQITHHIAGRLQQHVKRELRKRIERPYGIGDGIAERAQRDSDRADAKTARDGALFGAARPVKRPQPIKYRQNRSPLESPAMLDMIDRYGRFIPEDQRQFIIKRHRKGRPVYESPENMAKLHTRKPTRMEFWTEVCTETDRKRFRAQIAETFNLGICECTECVDYVK